MLRQRRHRPAAKSFGLPVQGLPHTTQSSPPSAAPHLGQRDVWLALNCACLAGGRVHAFIQGRPLPSLRLLLLRGGQVWCIACFAGWAGPGGSPTAAGSAAPDAPQTAAATAADAAAGAARSVAGRAGALRGRASGGGALHSMRPASGRRVEQAEAAGCGRRRPAARGSANAQQPSAGGGPWTLAGGCGRPAWRGGSPWTDAELRRAAANDRPPLAGTNRLAGIVPCSSKPRWTSRVQAPRQSWYAAHPGKCSPQHPGALPRGFTTN